MDLWRVNVERRGSTARGPTDESLHGRRRPRRYPAERDEVACALQERESVEAPGCDRLAQLHRARGHRTRVVDEPVAVVIDSVARAVRGAVGGAWSARVEPRVRRGRRGRCGRRIGRGLRPRVSGFASTVAPCKGSRSRLTRDRCGGDLISADRARVSADCRLPPTRHAACEDGVEQAVDDIRKLREEA